MRRNENFKLGEHLPFLGALFALGFWIFDSLVNPLLFGESTIIEQLLHPEPVEIYFRLMVGGLFLLLGIIAGRLVKEQKKLKAENQFKATVLDQVNDVIMIHDFEGRIIYFNGATCRMRGFSRSELVNLKMSQITAPQYRELMPARLKEIKEKGELIFEAETMNKDGSSTPVEVHARRIEVNGEQVVMSIARDISVRREYENSRDKLVKELQTALIRIKTLKGLIPICSHCKKIRNDQGYWQQVEEFIKEHTDADFSYGLCDACARELYPEFSGTGRAGENDKQAGD
jgi:PAS domain S-box-containing protein